MTVNEIAKTLGASVIVQADKAVESFYAGDFLSRVMGKAPSKCCWFTVMNNVNVAGVATLADVSVILLCEGVKPDDRLTEKCQSEQISLLTTDLDVYSAIVKLNQ